MVTADYLMEASALEGIVHPGVKKHDKACRQGPLPTFTTSCLRNPHRVSIENMAKSSIAILKDEETLNNFKELKAHLKKEMEEKGEANNFFTISENDKMEYHTGPLSILVVRGY